MIAANSRGNTISKATFVPPLSAGMRSASMTVGLFPRPDPGTLSNIARRAARVNSPGGLSSKGPSAVEADEYCVVQMLEYEGPFSERSPTNRSIG